MAKRQKRFEVLAERAINKDGFIKECKLKKINRLITDCFEFMENNNFFKSNGFTLLKKENITKNLEMIWYELNLT